METIPASEVNANLVRNALRHKWPVIVVSVLLLTALGLFAGRSMAAAYTSTTSVLLKASTGNVLSVDSAKSSQQITVAMTTEAELVTSPQVTDLVNAKLGTTIPPSSGAVAVTVPVSTQILQIVVTADTAADAQQRSEAFAEAYLAYRASASKTLVDQQVKDLDAQAKTASAGLKKATDDADTAQPSAEAVTRLQLYSNRLAAVQDSITTVKSGSSDPGTVIAPATLPTDASGLPSWVFLVAGAAFGLALGCVIALWRERADDRVRFDSTATVDGLPVLASLVGSEPADEESLRQLRASVVRLGPAPSVLAVVPVSDAVPTDLVVTAGAGLARALARAGYRTTLVDATMHEAHDSVAGLSDWLLDVQAGPLSQAIEQSSKDATVDGVHRIAGGKQTASARDLLAGERFASGMRDLADEYDYVVVMGTSPSTGSGADLALVADHGIAVGRERTTTHEHVRELLERTGRTGPILLGLVSTRGSTAAGPLGRLTRAENTDDSAKGASNDTGSGKDGGADDRGHGARVTTGASERAQAKRARGPQGGSTASDVTPSPSSSDRDPLTGRPADADSSPHQTVP